ncbi:MAG: acetyl/propionyl/methylcrotonyl-CoA carboxylase subunit alpha [Rhodobacteraceae bacterium]|nr:acetyl/propionyl/methylcrotonyl-CoA carboxylase subunit alpha [Paracoccaceae bacterium]
MFKKLLIANRGEIACRVIKTARKMGITTVAIYSDADRNALHVTMADEAVHIGPPPAAESYIVIDKVMGAIRRTGAQAVHPGYGFLSENKTFAKVLEAEGVAFIGPPAGAIESMGDKITSKKIAQEAGVSTVPGHMGLIRDADEAVKISGKIGYPVMLKASAGGGGKGMRIAWTEDEVREGFHASRNEAVASFGDDRMFIEKCVTQPRHIEIQVLADSHGNAIYLGERECSIQRRNQKVIEEAPSPFLDTQTRKAMGEQAVALAQAVGYTSAGTVEFIVDGNRNFYFLEMNTRLQVEHPVTELITGVDLVEQMIRIAAGAALPFTQKDITLTGWAMESRLYAEDPYRNFLPSIGRLTRYRPPQEVAAGPLLDSGKWQGDAPAGATAVRNDTGVFEGGEIPMYYDPMIAKLCTWASDRATVIEAMRNALDGFELEGIGHNLPFLAAVMDHPKFVMGQITTAFIAEEYPDGFTGVTPGGDDLKYLAAVAAHMNMLKEARAAQISGTMPNHSRRVAPDWVAVLGCEAFPVHVERADCGTRVTFDDGTHHKVISDWHPGDTLFIGTVGEHPMIVKTDFIRDGVRLRYRGVDMKAILRTPRQAELATLMPRKLPPDTSKLLLCPMPGLIVKVDVKEGQEVQEGQALCTIEAMKMENILRAGKTGVVARINAAPGDSLAVDDVIMEFE